MYNIFEAFYHVCGFIQTRYVLRLVKSKNENQYFICCILGSRRVFGTIVEKKVNVSSFPITGFQVQRLIFTHPI